MADVFISYSKSEPELTKRLAQELEDIGFSVWWDTGLLSGDAYSEKILEQLDSAKAVIVIWTPRSVKSRWVRAEARRADEDNKLIPVRSDGVDAREIPPPFGEYHTVLVTNIETIAASLRKLNVGIAAAGSFRSGDSPRIDGRSMLLRTHDRFRTEHECDTLAAHPADEDRVGRGVHVYDLDTTKALAACESALAANPSEPRFLHQLGRVNYALKDYEKARSLFTHAADLGYPATMLSLGLLMGERGTPIANPREAIEWYERAAANGNSEAMCRLAWESAKDTVSWFEKAAARGNADSMYQLGRICEVGLFTQQNLGTARSWYEKSSAHGNEFASYRLAEIYGLGVDTTRNVAIAEVYLEKAAACDNGEILLKIAIAYDEGTIVQKNHARAAALLLDAMFCDDQNAGVHLLGDMAGWAVETIQETKAILKQYGFVGALDGTWDDHCRSCVKIMLE